MQKDLELKEKMELIQCLEKQINEMNSKLKNIHSEIENLKKIIEIKKEEYEKLNNEFNRVKLDYQKQIKEIENKNKKEKAEIKKKLYHKFGNILEVEYNNLNQEINKKIDSRAINLVNLFKQKLGQISNN